MRQFTLNLKDSKYYNPGIARDVFWMVDPGNPRTLIVETHPIDYLRTVTVYVPAQYVPGAPAPFIVTHDGPQLGRGDLNLAHVLDNLWMGVGDRDNYNPNVMRDDLHDWVANDPAARAPVARRRNAR